MATDADRTRGSAAPAAQRAADSRRLRRLAAVGLVGYGLLHLLIAWLALQLGWHAVPAGDRETGPTGAMALVAGTPGGAVLLWLLAAGLAGLCVWQAVEVLRHHRRPPPPGAERRRTLVQVVKTAGTAVLYGYLAVSAARFAAGRGPQRNDDEQVVRGVLAWPGGQVLVVAVGLGVIGIGAYHVRKGWRSDFLGELDLRSVRPSLRAATHRFCQLGFVLKGVALVLVGAMVAWAAITFDPEQASGLDGALRAVAAEPHGRWVLAVVATGLATFAVYCLARARHPVG